tara:strand:+ start:173 stop:796 length:624 start_codon:yes stop_codon:yes gene_type:complete
MAGSTFWSSTDLEPKRQFKFLFEIPGPPELPNSNIESYLVKSVNKPQVTIQTGATVNFIQHTFKYPGRLTWNDISVTLIDTIRVDDTSSRLADIIRASGYIIPNTFANSQFSFSKKSATNALNKPRLQQITAGNLLTGEKPEIVEEWTLWNAWINSVNFGAGLDYSADAIVNVTLGITYDWAEYTTIEPGGELNYNQNRGFQQKPAD